MRSDEEDDEIDPEYYESGGDYFERDDQELDLAFADPGGDSALRAATPTNPRDQPCPTCHWPNRLTPKDVALGYQCDCCANALERGTDINYYEGDEDAGEDETEDGP